MENKALDIRKAITVAEAARQLGVNRETVRRAILSGMLRAFQPGDEANAPYLVDPASLKGFSLGKPGRPPGRKDSSPRTRRRREEVTA